MADEIQSEIPQSLDVASQLDGIGKERINIFKITRGACRKLIGPCPHLTCRYNMISEPRRKSGPMQASPRPQDLSEVCALDLADRGGMTLEEISVRLSITRERVRQIEFGALKKLLGVFVQEGEETLLQALSVYRDL